MIKKSAQSQPYLYHQQQLSAHLLPPIPPQLPSFHSKFNRQFISQSHYPQNNKLLTPPNPVSPLHSTGYSSAATSVDGYL